MSSELLGVGPSWAFNIWRLAKQLKTVDRIRNFATATDPFGSPPSHPQRRVVVTGIGLVTPLGIGTDRVWQRVLAGETAVRALQETDLPEAHRNAFSQLPSKVIACVPQDEFQTCRWKPQEDARRMAPFMSYALMAAAEALQDAQWHPESPEDRHATGVAIGAGMSCTEDMSDAGILLQAGRLRKLSPFFVPRTLVNMAAGAVSIAHGLQGPNHAVSTACATGAHAIGDAFRLVQRGDAEVMLAGGTEACVDAVALGGFCRLKALSTGFNDRPEAASRPFDRSRDGFVMGEGAGVLVLEEMEHARRRNAKIYGEIRGYGLSADAHHVTQPPPDGSGAQLAMQRALKTAGLKPADVAYLNAHATSTPIGDDVEQRAVATVFGDATSRLAVSSTKGAIGHLLGAAGAVEAAFTVLSLFHNVAPPTVNLEDPDPALLARLVRGKAVPLPRGSAALTNSFGFGGTNASLAFGPRPQDA
jgi:3-oxoacyl-[acyl-carrier-protein] synthase II